MEQGRKERYSFSKLSSFETCKYGFEQTYIKHIKGENNCFASYGSFVHSILERYARGEIDLEHLVSVYEWEYPTAVPEPFPKSKFCDMSSLYYKEGLNFLKGFEGYDKSKILEVESKFDIDIDDWKFNGIIDLILTDGDKIILQDYKSKAKFKNKIEKAHYARQLYMYSLYIKEKYGKFPDLMRFLLFRKNEYVDIPFSIDEFNKTIDWAKETVNNIRTCWVYPTNYDEFFCENLCNHRGNCPKK